MYGTLLSDATDIRNKKHSLKRHGAVTLSQSKNKSAAFNVKGFRFLPLEIFLFKSLGLLNVR